MRAESITPAKKFSHRTTSHRAWRWPAAPLILLATGACSGGRCDNHAFFGLPSPDGAFIAFVFHRSCAAPAGVSTEVSLMPFHESLRNAAGNVLSVAGEQPVRVAWRGPATLVVTGFHEPRVRITRLDSINIEFH